MKNRKITAKISAGVLMLLFVFLPLMGCNTERDTADYKPDFLVLVNKEHLISDDYISTVKLCEIGNIDGGTYEVEVTTKKAFEDLQKALSEKGVVIGVDSAYRSVAYQQQIMDDFITEYGEDYAKRTVAIPGTSEHHTGLVIDLVPEVNGNWVVENEDMLKETDIFRIIHETIPEFGFIVRYPLGKEAITGYDYEPWHIRYVGVEAAKAIYERGITLEEYLGQ